MKKNYDMNEMLKFKKKLTKREEEDLNRLLDYNFLRSLDKKLLTKEEVEILKYLENEFMGINEYQDYSLSDDYNIIGNMLKEDEIKILEDCLKIDDYVSLFYNAEMISKKNKEVILTIYKYKNLKKLYENLIEFNDNEDGRRIVREFFGIHTSLIEKGYEKLSIQIMEETISYAKSNREIALTVYHPLLDLIKEKPKEKINNYWLNLLINTHKYKVNAIMDGEHQLYEKNVNEDLLNSVMKKIIEKNMNYEFKVDFFNFVMKTYYDFEENKKTNTLINSLGEAISVDDVEFIDYLESKVDNREEFKDILLRAYKNKVSFIKKIIPTKSNLHIESKYPEIKEYNDLWYMYNIVKGVNVEESLEEKIKIDHREISLNDLLFLIDTTIKGKIINHNYISNYNNKDMFSNLYELMKSDDSFKVYRSNVSEAIKAESIKLNGNDFLTLLNEEMKKFEKRIYKSDEYILMMFNHYMIKNTVEEVKVVPIKKRKI